MNGESEILAQIAAGDKKAYEQIVRRYHRALFYLVVRRVGSSADAEDIVQDTFITAFQRIGGYERERQGSFGSWLWGIARNRCMHFWRERERRSRMEERLLELAKAEMCLRDLERETAEVSVIERRMSALRSCLESLGSRDRELVEKRFMEKVSLKTMGAAVGKSADAVRLTLFRLRQRLRNCIERRLAEEVSG